MTQRHYKEFGRGHRPGGFSCPCCNAWGKSPRRAKPLERRDVRRKMKIDLKKVYVDE